MRCDMRIQRRTTQFRIEGLKVDEIGSPPNDLGDERVPHGFGPVESLGLAREVLEESVVAYAAETFSVGAYGVVGGPLFVAFAVCVL